MEQNEGEHEVCFFECNSRRTSVVNSNKVALLTAPVAQAPYLSTLTRILNFNLLRVRHKLVTESNVDMTRPELIFFTIFIETVHYVIATTDCKIGLT